MNFSINQKEFIRLLQKAQGVVEKKEIRPILSTILIIANDDSVELNATNLETSLKLRGQAGVAEAGSVVLDARKIYEIVKELPAEEILFEKKQGTRVAVSLRNIHFVVVGLDKEEFPETPSVSPAAFQKVKGEVLKEMIDKTLYAASSDETRHNLNGVFFHSVQEEGALKMRLIATDGHRLAVISKGVEELGASGEMDVQAFEKGVLFPRKGLIELRKMLDEGSEKGGLEMAYTKSMGFFKKNDETLAVRVIDEEFPNYSQAIPDTNKIEVALSRREFQQCLKRVSLMSEERSKAVTIEFFKNGATMSAANPIYGEARETITAGYEGSGVKIGVNAGYFIDTLAAIDSETVLLKINDKDRPILITPGDEMNYKCVIMPMEIKE